MTDVVGTRYPLAIVPLQYTCHNVRTLCAPDDTRAHKLHIEHHIQ